MKILKFILIILLIIIFIIFLVNIYIIIVTKKKLLTDYKKNFDAIIVLGSSIKDGRPGILLQDRLDKAIELYKNGVSNKIIMSGDSITRSYHDETGVMKDYAILNGVEENDIILDNAGLSTYDTMWRAYNLFNIKSAVVVTQKYHLYRSIYDGNGVGMDTYGVYTIKRENKGDTYRYIREVFARCKDIVKCIFRPKAKYEE